MVVISLFDGISVGRMALKDAGINIKRYYSSEIDKYALAISNYNFPEDKNYRLGNIININGKKLLKEIKKEFPKDKILLIGGSPCTDLSISGKRKGMITKNNIEITTLDQYLELKEKKFIFEGQSYLFWEYVRLREEIKPDFILLENVRMSKKWKEVFNRIIGFEPIEINSALVSAQQRKRLYWIGKKNKNGNYEKINIPLPEDKKIFLKDILLPNTYTEREKSLCITATYSLACPRDYFFKSNRQLVFNKPVRIGKIGKGGQGDRIYSIEGKSVTLSANGGGRGAKTGLYLLDNNVRKLHPIECERLQTLPDGYTQFGIFENEKIKEISKTQRYKTLGNSWTMKVISHIFKHMLKD